MFYAYRPEDSFRRAKAIDYFRCLDRNGNGRLERDDLLVVVARIQELAPQHLVADADALQGAWTGLWDHLVALMDTDEDGVISEEEFTRFFHKASATALKAAEVPEWAVAHVHATLAALDLDGDGSVSLEEYTTYLRAIGSDAEPGHAFERCDSNGDGRLDLGELSSLFGEWLTAGKPGGAGNLLVTGRLPV